MKNSRLRRQIAWEAARLMYDRQESEYYRAKMKAAKRICQGWVKPADLPSNAEIRDEIQSFARLIEGDSRDKELPDMRVAAIVMMRRLAAFRPRLIGSVMTGHVRQGSDIDLHLFCDAAEPIAHILEQEGLECDVEHKHVRKQGEERVFKHIHVTDRFVFELTVYASDQAQYVFKSSITGKAIERATLPQLERLMHQWYPGINLDDEIASIETGIDPYQLFEALLLPLENVKQNAKYHPEGDVLYHSLQVFDHARDQMPYDEEFLQAALLHDVGKGIDPYDHVATGLEALAGFISERTAWLIEHHMMAHQLADGTLGARARKRLQQHEFYEDLLILEQCDRAGRQAGVIAPELEEALDYLRQIGGMFA